jgi:hypothetical protein
MPCELLRISIKIRMRGHRVLKPDSNPTSWERASHANPFQSVGKKREEPSVLPNRPTWRGRPPPPVSAPFPLAAPVGNRAPGVWWSGRWRWRVRSDTTAPASDPLPAPAVRARSLVRHYCRRSAPPLAPHSPLPSETCSSAPNPWAWIPFGDDLLGVGILCAGQPPHR